MKFIAQLERYSDKPYKNGVVWNRKLLENLDFGMYMKNPIITHNFNEAIAPIGKVDKIKFTEIGIMVEGTLENNILVKNLNSVYLAAEYIVKKMKLKRKFWRFWEKITIIEEVEFRGCSITYRPVDSKLKPIKCV